MIAGSGTSSEPSIERFTAPRAYASNTASSGRLETGAGIAPTRKLVCGRRASTSRVDASPLRSRSSINAL